MKTRQVGYACWPSARLSHDRPSDQPASSARRSSVGLLSARAAARAVDCTPQPLQRQGPSAGPSFVGRSRRQHRPPRGRQRRPAMAQRRLVQHARREWPAQPRRPRRLRCGARRHAIQIVIAHIAMAYIVMAYISCGIYIYCQWGWSRLGHSWVMQLLPCLGVAYIVMAYIVMANWPA